MYRTHESIWNSRKFIEHTVMYRIHGNYKTHGNVFKTWIIIEHIEIMPFLLLNM